MWLTASVATISVWELFYLWLCFVSVFNTDPVCVCSFYSFGKQLGGRRGCECITLEPSEMIVVSRNTVCPALALSLPKPPPFLSSYRSHLRPFDIIPVFVFFAIFIWCLRYLFTRVAFSSSSFFSPFLSSLSLFLPVSPISVPPLCALPPPLPPICPSSDSNSDELHWQDALPNCSPFKSRNYRHIRKS